MPESIFRIGSEGELETVEETFVADEDRLQELLARYPDILPATRFLAPHRAGGSWWHARCQSRTRRKLPGSLAKSSTCWDSFRTHACAPRSYVSLGSGSEIRRT